MNLTALKGNERVKEQLSQQERRRGLSHAYILSGPGGSGRHTLVRLLAAGLLCDSRGEKPCGQCGSCLKVGKGVHPDVSVIAGPGKGKSITVDQVRALRSDAYIRPNEGSRKVYLLEDADQMNASAQNAMLKLLEEGPRYASFLLIANNADALLETVRSRCEELDLLPAGRPAEAAGGPERSELVSRMANALEGTDELKLLEMAGEFTAESGRSAYPAERAGGGAVRQSGPEGRGEPSSAGGGAGKAAERRGPAQSEWQSAVRLAVRGNV